jgi:DNA-binding beta-propeller fold protein YncE
MRTFFVLPILLLAAAPAFAEDPLVVLAADPMGRIRFFDAALSPLGSIGVIQQVESVAASPDGRRLYIARRAEKTTASSCCGLYSLDLDTRGMCLLAASALFGAPSPDGRFLFTQGASGVDVFDATTLSRLPTMKASGTYNLQPSPDGRWLLGITNAPQLSYLDTFDMGANAMVRRLPISPGPVTGAWAGDRFYLFSYGAYRSPGTGWLWNVKPEDNQLPPPTGIELPDLHGACHEPVLLMLAGAPDRLYLAEAFGFKVDRRLACPDAARDGVYVIHPSTGRVSHIASAVRVNRMVVSPDGRDLYVIDSGGPSPPGKLRLLHIDSRTGGILHETALGSGPWNLTLARIPPALIPREYVRASSSCSR